MESGGAGQLQRGGNWAVSGNNATVTVNAAQTGSTTITNTYADASFACSVLDNFNRSNGKLGSNWAGNADDYRVKDNAAYLNDSDGDIILWNRAPATFGANQYACLTLTKINTSSEKHALILKAQGTDARNGMIKVAYVPKYKRVDVWSIQPGQGWVKRATINNVTLVNGDKFAARAYADGSVRVYKNGASIGTSQTSSYFVNRTGRIGVWFLNAEGARFDDFGGGNFTP